MRLVYLALGLLLLAGACGDDAADPLDAAAPRPDAPVVPVPDAADTPDAAEGTPDAAGTPDAGTGDAAPVTGSLSPTAGGTRLESASYRLELFVAPASPVGSTASSGHRLKLGPASLRKPR